MAMRESDFAVFILSHGRADRVQTLKTLERGGYTGRVYIVIDNEDRQEARYREKYGAQVVVFDKAAIAETFDEGDNFQDRRAVIYARNACFDIARQLGITYFLQLDDDYQKFEYRFDAAYRYSKKLVCDLDNLFDLLLDFYKTVDAKSVALLQSGDLIGGWNSPRAESVTAYRKCMNTFICSTERSFQFVGRINEDVNTYTWYQSLGNLFLSINSVTMQQADTQTTTGGMTDLYMDSGTYIKSFYTVMYAPSCVHIAPMGVEHYRLHHRIHWQDAVPCIVSEKHRKLEAEVVSG